MSQEISYSLSPYEGTLGDLCARHLLSRSLFGVSPELINKYKTKTATEALELLTREADLPAAPIGVRQADLEVPVGSSWTNVKYNATYRSHRLYSLRAWWIDRTLRQKDTLHEKLMLFWHNHFATETEIVRNTNYLYKHYQLLFGYCLGSFSDLLDRITIDPAMLIYLDGRTNKVGAANENYGRELLELFTVGKGPLIAPGNYTNYTEEDIREASRVLTGWQINNNTEASFFNNNGHDKGIKTFSAAFGNHQIANNGQDEFKLLHSMILNQKATAKNITRKIYRFFVSGEISDQTEEGIIEPLSEMYYNSGYNTKSLITKLLKSDHFYSGGLMGCLVKSPMELCSGLSHNLKLNLPDPQNPVASYTFAGYLFSQLQIQEMMPGDPPDVAGWGAFYSEPMFSRLWVNSATLPAKKTFITNLVNDGYKTTAIPVRIKPDYIQLAKDTGVPDDPSALIKAFAVLLFPQPLNNESLAHLSHFLLDGYGAAYWSSRWKLYTDNPNDNAAKSEVETRLQALISEMVNLPHYQVF